MHDGLNDPLESLLGYQMRRALLASMGELVDSFEKLGLRLAEATILRIIGSNPGCNQSAVGRALGVKRTNMVPIIATLEGRGLIVRAPADGRSNALSLTAEGEALLARADAVTRAHEERHFGDVTPELKAQILALCRQIRERVD